MRSLRVLFTLAMLVAMGAGSALAQADDVKVSGQVVDSAGDPVRGATVQRQDGVGEPAVTDDGGRFTISAPVDTVLTIDAADYQTNLVTVTGAARLEIVLVRLDEEGQIIEISGEAPPPAPGAANLDREELQRVPGTGGDFVRSLTAMPGVVNLQVPLGYSGVVIRGSSPQDSRVLIDEFEVPVLFHNIGFRAVLPAESIESLDYIPGGFDVGYGRASSGIVALRTRAGAEQRSAQAELSMIDGGLIAQGPIGERTNYMFALRRSTIDFFLPLLIPDSVDLSLTTVPSYWDEQFRIDHQLSSRWQLTLSSIGTDDVFELYATKNEEADEKRFFNRTRFLRLTGAARWSNGPWTAKLALSGLASEFVFEAGDKQYIRVQTPGVTSRAEVVHTVPRAGPVADVEWRVGTETQVTRSHAQLALPVEVREGETMPSYDPDDTSVLFDGRIWLPDYALWTALAGKVHRRVKLTGGLRADYFGRPDELVLQPRGEAQVEIRGPWSARLSVGEFRRPPEYQSEVLELGIGSERSTQFIAGLQYQRGALRGQTSAYYYDRSRLITRNPDGTLGNLGEGRTVGGEVLATYRGGPWFAWLSYSYSKSTRVDQPGGPTRLFSFDQPHSLNAAVSWKRGRWQLGGRFSLYSGLPFTPALGSVFDSDRNIYIPIYDEVNSDRAPLHHQVDVRIDRSFQAGPIELTGFLDVQNVYLNQSVVTYFYSYDYSERSAFKSLPFIPSLGLRGVL